MAENYYESRTPEKFVVLDQLKAVGQVMVQQVDTQERENFEDRLNAALLAVTWLEVVASPFLEDEPENHIDKKYTNPSTIKQKMEYIRQYGRHIVSQLHAKNLYFAQLQHEKLQQEKEEEQKADVDPETIQSVEDEIEAWL